MDDNTPRGRRLPVTTIDRLARDDPSRPWISVPRNDDDLSEGFVDINFKQLANAVNFAAAWLESILGNTTNKSEVFAYEGPGDARLPVLAVAAAKVGRQILLPFPFAPPHIRAHLLETTRCRVFVYDKDSQQSVTAVINDKPHVEGIIAPPLSSWFTEEMADEFVYRKTWDEAKNEPWIIFHTSGTTGLPRSMIYTNRMMTSIDVAESMSDAKNNTQVGYFSSKRVYSTIPMSHFVGLTGALQSPLWLGTTLVVGPKTKPATTAVAADVLSYGNVNGFVAPPFVIREMCHVPETLEVLKSMDFIHWGAAPLDQKTGETFCEYVKLASAIGSTESGPYFLRMSDDPRDWDYYYFRDGQGIHFDLRSDSVAELVFRRSPEAVWQQIFLRYPDLQEYRTKDLFEKHPVKPRLWRFAGRTDDVVTLANGENVHVASLEATIMRSPAVRGVLIGGNGRDKTFLIVHPAQQAERNAVLDVVWPAVEEANHMVPDFARISKELTIIAGVAKPFVWTGKTSLDRQATLDLYQDEIEQLFT